MSKIYYIDLSDYKIWFDYKVYKKLSIKLKNEAENLKIESGREYNLETLKRYCFYHNIKIFGSGKFSKKGVELYKYLSFLNYNFKIKHFDGQNYHATYEITNNIQTYLF